MPAVIQSISTQLVDLPTIRPHRLSMTTMACQTMVIIRLRDVDGVEGIGEATTIGGLSYGPESPESIKQNIDRYLAPLLIGEPGDNPNHLIARMNASVKGNRLAKSGLETALLDAHGKRLGLPLAMLLGGSRQEHLPVLWTLASGDTQRDIEEARQRIHDRQHRDFKLKIGARSVDEDIRHVASIKEALGDTASVRVDVNQAWDEATAIHGIAALQEAGVALIEQPLPAHDHAGLTRLAQRFAVPMLADEAVHDSVDALNLFRQGFHGAFALKIAKAGGPLSVLPMARLAQAAGIGLYGGTMLEGSIGTAASLHAWATLGRLEWGSEMFGPLLLKDDVVTQGLCFSDFGVALPSGPGLGTTLDEEKLAHYTRAA